MATRTWTIYPDGKAHTVLLKHGAIDGRKIWVDGVLVMQGRKFYDTGTRHIFPVAGKEYELNIWTNGWTFDYFLLSDASVIPSDQDVKKGRTPADIERKKIFKDLYMWRELSQLLGLRYRPIAENVWDFRHNLMGFWKGYFVMVQRALLYGNRYAWLIAIIHAPILSEPEAIKITEDERIKALRGSLMKNDKTFPSIQITPVKTHIFMPFDKKDTAPEMAARVRLALSVFAGYVRPLGETECENPECTRERPDERHLVNINGSLHLLCTECIAKIPGWGEKAKRTYEETPDNLLPGVVVATGLALLGVAVSAVISFVISGLGVLASLAVFNKMLMEMDKAGTKRTLGSMLIALVLSAGSMTLGLLLFFYSMAARLGYPLNLSTISDAWRTMNDSGVLGLAYFLIVGYGVIVIWTFFSNRKKELSDITRPRIEVLSDLP